MHELMLMRELTLIYELMLVQMLMQELTLMYELMLVS